MGNEIEDEIGKDLEEIIKTKYPEIFSGLQDEKLYLDWGEPELYEKTNKSSFSVDVIDSLTDIPIGRINFDVRIHWSRDPSFGGWDWIKIIKSSVKFEKME